MIDPLVRFAEDRARARDREDPFANLCTVVTVTASGEPAARVLVLREVEDRLAIFVNATSPKVAEFSASSTVAVLAYLPSVTVQYRLRCALQQIPPETVRAAWQMRPDIPKRMDWLYETHAQSSPIDGRPTLIEALAAVRLPEPLAAPETAVGYVLEAVEVERLDLAGAGGVHDRRRYTRASGAWLETVLVP